MNTSPFWDYVLEKGINTRRTAWWYAITEADAFGDGYAMGYDLSGDGAWWDDDTPRPPYGDGYYSYVGVGSGSEEESY